MDSRKKVKLSLILKTLVVIFTVLGVGLSYHYGYAKHYKCFLYFTQQSNLMIGLVDFIMIFLLVKMLKHNDYKISKKMLIIYEVFSTGILLTGIVFCFILTPAFLISGDTISEIEWDTYVYPSIIMHVIVPILALLDILLTLRTDKLNKKDSLWAMLFPLAYFIFATICYLCNVDFNKGENYPYFFLNYASPAGIFGFSNVAPYFIGSAYWIIIGFSMVALISLGLIAITNRFSRKYK